MKPAIMLFDEPTSALDPERENAVITIANEVNQVPRSAYLKAANKTSAAGLLPMLFNPNPVAKDPK